MIKPEPTQQADLTLDEVKVLRGYQYVRKLPGGGKLSARIKMEGGKKKLKVEAIVDLGEIDIK